MNNHAMKLPVIIAFLKQGQKINALSGLIFMSHIAIILFFKYDHLLPESSLNACLKATLNAGVKIQNTSISARFLAPPSTLLLIFTMVTIFLFLLQNYYALRAYFDRILFESLLDREHKDLPQNLLLSMDQTLALLKLIPYPDAPRSLDARIIGASKLIHKQLITLLLQIMFIIGNLIMII